MDRWETELGLRYPRPPTDGVESYFFSLDGGGRDLIIAALQDHAVDLMVEIGCFLCGSAIQWLEARQSLRVVGIDPWYGDFAGILERYRENPIMASCFAKIPDKQRFIDSVREHGPYVSALANTRPFGARFLPVKDYSPAALYALAETGASPGLIYFDSNKVLDDIEVCEALFPNAVLSGDDWTWGADKGFPVRTAVNAFCERKGYAVVAKHASWVIDKRHSQ